MDGTCHEVEGPRRIWIYMSHVRFLDRHCASQNQYIRIQHKDGRIEHVKGPVELFCNPVKHESMKVKDAVELGVTDVVMIHSDRPSQKEIEPMCAGGEVGETRTLDASVVRGPAMFFPCANQRILELTWRTSDVDARQISKLSMASHTLILSVPAATSDKGEVQIKVSLSFAPRDLPKMMSKTSDPCGCMIDAARLDIVAACKGMRYHELLSALEQLCSLDRFPTLTAEAERVGCVAERAVCTGCEGSAQLQEIEASAMIKRSQLEAKMESAHQERELQDLELSASMSRQERENNVRRAEQNSALELEEAKHAKTLEMADRAHAQHVKHMREEREIELSFYEGLKARAGVDITQLLVAKETSASMPRETLKAVGPPRRSEIDSTLTSR